MGVAVTGDIFTPSVPPGHPNELNNRTLQGHQIVCCGEKPRITTPFAGNSMMAKWVHQGTVGSMNHKKGPDQATTKWQLEIGKGQDEEQDLA